MQLVCQHVTKQIRRYSGAILSRNTCRKIDSNAFEKKEEVVSVFVCNGKTEEAEKLVKLGFWAENLAESNKGLLLRPGAMVEGVERAAQHQMRPVGFHMNIHLVHADQKLRNFGKSSVRFQLQVGSP